MEGTRPLLIELQALTSHTVFGLPRRTANGIDYNRLTLLMAVTWKKSRNKSFKSRCVLECSKWNKNFGASNRSGNSSMCGI